MTGSSAVGQRGAPRDSWVWGSANLHMEHGGRARGMKLGLHFGGRGRKWKQCPLRGPGQQCRHCPTLKMWGSFSSSGGSARAGWITLLQQSWVLPHVRVTGSPDTPNAWAQGLGSGPTICSTLSHPEHVCVGGGVREWGCHRGSHSDVAPAPNTAWAQAGPRAAVPDGEGAWLRLHAP